MCKSEHIFDDFFGQAIAINIWKTPVKNIFNVLEDGFKIFDRFKNVTLSRSEVWNPPLPDGSMRRWILTYQNHQVENQVDSYICMNQLC